MANAVMFPIGYHHESQCQLQSWLTGNSPVSLYYYPPYQSAHILYALYEDIRLTLALLFKEYGLERYLGDIQAQARTRMTVNDCLKKLDSRKRFFLHIRTFQALSNWPYGFEQFLFQRPLESNGIIVGEVEYTLEQGNLAPLLELRRRWKNYDFVSSTLRSWIASSKPKSAFALRYTDSSTDSAPLSQQEVSDLLGISSTHILSLIDAGFLCIDGTYGGDSRTRYITCKSMLSFMSSVDRKVSVEEEHSYFVNELVTLSEAHTIFVEAGLEFVDIVHCLLDSAVVFYIPIHRNGWRVQDLLCVETSLRAWVSDSPPK